jgi:hypothetical protein
MPSIKANRDSLADAIKNGSVVPVTPPAPALPIPVATYPAAPNSFLRTPLPAINVQQPDMQRQWQTGATPQVRIPPTSATSNAVVGAQAASQIIKIVQGGGGTILETNNIKNNSQSTLNLIQGPGITLSSDSQGGVTVVGTSTGDGLTHGDAVWEHDSAYVELRDDFVPNFAATFQSNTVLGIGELGWSLIGSVRVQNQWGGNPPYLGQFTWENQNVANTFGCLILNGEVTTAPAVGFAQDSFALLENPGWKQTWVWKHGGGTSGTGDFTTTKKSFYIGFSGSPIQNIAIVTQKAPRPDIFIGLRYDTSVTPGALTLSSVAAASGGNTAYTGTITGGANGAYIGLTFVVTGFVASAGINNGTFVCTNSSVTVLTLHNASGVVETHAGTATGPTGLNDSFYTFEAVINPQFTTGARHNLQGQTFVTNVAPTKGTWHRLDITCSAIGVITMTLDGSATNTFTVTVPTATVTMSASGQVSCNAKIGRVQSTVGTAGTESIPPFSAGSLITVSALTGGNVALNGTWTLFYGNGVSLYWDAPAVANIGNNTMNSTVIGYPSLTPICIYGNDDTASPTANTMGTSVDFFSLVWNPNLGPSAPGTPDKTKARYW